MSIALLDVELLQFKCYVTSSIEVKMARFAIYGLMMWLDEKLPDLPTFNCP